MRAWFLTYKPPNRHNLEVSAQRGNFAFGSLGQDPSIEIWIDLLKKHFASYHVDGAGFLLGDSTLAVSPMWERARRAILTMRLSGNHAQNVWRIAVFGTHRAPRSTTCETMWFEQGLNWKNPCRSSIVHIGLSSGISCIRGISDDLVWPTPQTRGQSETRVCADSADSAVLKSTTQQWRRVSNAAPDPKYLFFQNHGSGKLP